MEFFETTQIVAFFCKKICYRDLSNIAQSNRDEYYSAFYGNAPNKVAFAIVPDKNKRLKRDKS